MGLKEKLKNFAKNQINQIKQNAKKQAEQQREYNRTYNEEYAKSRKVHLKKKARMDAKTSVFPQRNVANDDFGMFGSGFEQPTRKSNKPKRETDFGFGLY